MRQTIERQWTQQMPMATLVSGMCVSVAVFVIGCPMAAILVVMAMLAKVRRCASEMSVQAMVALVAMVNGGPVERYA